MSATRKDIYYWKCDRQSVASARDEAENPLPPARLSEAQIIPMLANLLRGHFGAALRLEPAGGTGNHRTYRLHSGEQTFFVRVEDGAESDAHLVLESGVLHALAQTPVPVPRVYFTDASRSKVPFAVQVIEYFDCPDLNRSLKNAQLDIDETAREIGRCIALWQAVPVRGFGPFNPEDYAAGKGLCGYHASYADYFNLQLERHLHLLERHALLTTAQAQGIRSLIASHASLLAIPATAAVLVHKDLALWNIMGTQGHIRAFIDWDDAIGGDPCDDLSLLACFHPASAVLAATEGYATVRALPQDFIPRFWLHLLRNMIVKAVIRCQSGYFTLCPASAARNFLIPAGMTPAGFATLTRERLLRAANGLQHAEPITFL